MTGTEVVNIACHLAELARTRPDAPAVYCPEGRDRYDHWTYRQLDRASDTAARRLARIGVTRGVRTVLMVKPGLEFFALTFALFKAGAVPVLIDPGMGVKNLGRCFAEAEPEAFLGIPRAQLARRLLGWGKATIRVSQTVRARRAWDDDATSFPIAPTRADETAAILFTSGSTGPPKGAVYTHAIFAHQVEMLRNLYGIEPGEIDLCTFPLFALFAPALGMTAVVPEMDATRPGAVDPTKILEPIARFGVTNLFGSPALIKRVGTYGAAHGIKLPTLRRVISAGAPVPARVLDTFASMLAENVQIFTPYGATEALPVASIGSDEILGNTRHQTDRGAGVCVGLPVEGMRVALIRITDEPIPDWSEELLVPDGTIGEIAVQGPVVTRAYYQRPEANALAKIADPAGQGGYWHRMGDVGYRDERGRLWFCGRKAHRVITTHGTLFTIPCEAVFNTHEAVERTALVGVGTPGAQTPVLCVELRRHPDLTAVYAGIAPIREPVRRPPPAPPSQGGELVRGWSAVLLPPLRRGGRGGVRWLGCNSWVNRCKLRIDVPQIRRELLEIGARHAHTREIQTILFHPSFPVDIRHNAKIFREKLAVWAARRLR